MRDTIPAKFRFIAGVLSAALLSVVGCQVLRWRNPASPEALLERADEMSWLNDWVGAAPLYRQAELIFMQTNQRSKALYARASELPAHSESSVSIPTLIAKLTQDLSLPEASDPETRLRIQTVLGMLEVNYDSGMAKKTWNEVEKLALTRHHYLLATRAMGEQGIAAFLLGDIATAKKNVVRAWFIAKAADPGAHIRYASMYGTGLVELQKYNEALGPLDEAIKVAQKTPGAAYPTIAITAKIEALSGLGKYAEALALADEELQKIGSYNLAGHYYEFYQTRAGVYEKMGRWEQAISDYELAVRYAKDLSYWRGVTQVDGLLARAELQRGALQPALTAINEAILANERIPDELYFAPRNLAIKAQITARLRDLQSSNELYERSADLLDALLSKVPTPTIERNLLSELDKVYSGYFESLCDQGRTADGFRVIERARGRVEAQSLRYHEVAVPHEVSSAEQHLIDLNLKLLDSSDAAVRGHILDAIYQTELGLETDSNTLSLLPKPVDLLQLQTILQPKELFLEYVLDDPQSYVIAVTRKSVSRYTLPSRGKLEKEAMQYRSEILKQGTDPALAQELFNNLLGQITEYRENQTLIVVPDGKLHLLPFSALMNGGQYVLSSHLLSVVPSGTVLHLLRERDHNVADDNLPFVGVAAWTTNYSSETALLASIRRAVSGPERKELITLPESRHEVETIAADLPQPSTILLGGDATETGFKKLPLEKYNVIHLALHGYVDPEFPDRSALVFAPQQQATDDGLLQVREIRKLRLNAKLVTLSACSTGVGAIGEEGVANVVNAFIEAGSLSVVSTLWELEDHATAHLMTTFYKHLSRRESKGEAMRQAQIEMQEAGSPPFYWAGFTLDGDSAGSLF